MTDNNSHAPDPTAMEVLAGATAVDRSELHGAGALSHAYYRLLARSRSDVRYTDPATPEYRALQDAYDRMVAAQRREAEEAPDREAAQAEADAAHLARLAERDAQHADIDIYRAAYRAKRDAELEASGVVRNTVRGRR